MVQKRLLLFINSLLIGAALCFFGCGTVNDDDDSSDADSDTDSDSDTDTDTDADTDSDTDTDTDTDADGDSDDWNQMGVCGMEGEATVTVDAYNGTEYLFLMGPSPDNDNDICRISYEIDTTSDEPPAGCDTCDWKHTVEFSNVQVVTDLDGNCGNSQLGMGADELEELEGKVDHYGFIPDYEGHAATLMRYDDEDGEWVPVCFADWNPKSGEFSYNKLEGYCGYIE